MGACDPDTWLIQECTYLIVIQHVHVNLEVDNQLHLTSALLNTITQINVVTPCRCKALRAVLWQAFHHEQVVPTTQEQATSSTVTGDQRQPSGVPITPMSSTAAASQQQAAKASAGQSADLSTCDEDDKAAPASVQVLDYRALLLYLSADRNLFTGIRKAMAVVTGDASPHAHATADQVVRMAYPLLTPDTGQAIHRAPPTAAQIAAAVKAAYDNRGGDATAVPSVTAEQVMYSPACDRVISLLMTRYQAKDVYIAARL